PEVGSAIDITGGVKDHARLGTGAVRATRKGIKYSFRPRTAGSRRQFEDYSTTTVFHVIATGGCVAALVRGAVKISLGIERHAANNIEAGADAAKGIKNALGPCAGGTGTKLENDAAAG